MVKNKFKKYSESESVLLIGLAFILFLGVIGNILEFNFIMFQLVFAIIILITVYKVR